MDYRPKKSIDIWLNDKGFYRKHVPMDETCFFRAISDQIYSTQIYHEDLRKKGIEFAQKSQHLFKDLLGPKELDEHLFNLANHFVICGNIEMQIMSKMLERDFIIIDSDNFKTENLTNNDFKEFITLCKMRDDHYDSILPKNQVETAGFCQSLIYKLLYEDVFGFENVDDIVSEMLYPNDKMQPRDINLFDAFLPAEPENNKDKYDVENNPPFPYKVAKALDPKQYRNIEFDAWNQTRKEFRLKDWYMGGNDFKVGTKCLLVVDCNSFDCYIQELNYRGKKNVCLVYVVPWAMKEVVKREELIPMPDAKPWPLPYTLSKCVEKTFLEITTEKNGEPKNRKSKNGRRSFVNSRTFSNSNFMLNDTNNNNEVSCLEGCALVASPEAESSNIVPYEFNDEPNGIDQQMCNMYPPYPAPYLLPHQVYNPQMSLPNQYNPNLQISGATQNKTNPQMSVATQYNATIHQENNNTKVTTVYRKFIEKTYTNNNGTMPNLNVLTPPPSPDYHVYSENCPLPLPSCYQEQIPLVPVVYPINQPVPVVYPDGNMEPIMPVPPPSPILPPAIQMAPPPLIGAPVLSPFWCHCNCCSAYYNGFYVNVPPNYPPPPVAVTPAPCYPVLPSPVQDYYFEYDPQNCARPASPPNSLVYYTEENN